MYYFAEIYPLTNTYKINCYFRSIKSRAAQLYFCSGRDKDGNRLDLHNNVLRLEVLWELWWDSNSNKINYIGSSWSCLNFFKKQQVKLRLYSQLIFYFFLNSRALVNTNKLQVKYTVDVFVKELESVLSHQKTIIKLH